MSKKIFIRCNFQSIKILSLICFLAACDQPGVEIVPNPQTSFEKSDQFEKSKPVKIEVDPISTYNLPKDWKKYSSLLSAQQIKFCLILAEYEKSIKSASVNKNQIKKRAAIENRDEKIQKLLSHSSDGENNSFEKWVGRVDRVFLIKNIKGEVGAGVVLDTPCGVTIGSGNQVVENPQINAAREFGITALPGELIFKQLEQLSYGDMVIINGGFLTYDDEKKSVKFLTNLKKQSSAVKSSNNLPDYLIKISYLSQL